MHHKIYIRQHFRKLWKSNEHVKQLGCTHSLLLVIINTRNWGKNNFITSYFIASVLSACSERVCDVWVTSEPICGFCEKIYVQVLYVQAPQLHKSCNLSRFFISSKFSIDGFTGFLVFMPIISVAETTPKIHIFCAYFAHSRLQNNDNISVY